MLRCGAIDALKRRKNEKKRETKASPLRFHFHLVPLSLASRSIHFSVHLVAFLVSFLLPPLPATPAPCPSHDTLIPPPNTLVTFPLPFPSWSPSPVSPARGEGEGFLMRIEPWYMDPVPTYRVNKHKDRRNIRQQTADRRQTASVNRKHKTGGKGRFDYKY
jgi:hypothetical protein